MVLYVEGSRSCLVCGAHVASGQALVAVRAVLDGGTFAPAGPTEGVMCADRVSCEARARLPLVQVR